MPEKDGASADLERWNERITAGSAAPYSVESDEEPARHSQKS